VDAVVRAGRFVPFAVAIACLVLLPVSLLFGLGLRLELVALVLSVGSLVGLAAGKLTFQQELRQARVRALDAIDLERQRIQRDLHDGAQQRLVSVRIHLSLLERRATARDEREAIEELGRELDAALVDIRSVTRNEAPQLLLRSGVADGLRAVAAHSPIPVSVESRRFARYAPQLERAVYFCCVEAVQNAVKHAGPAAMVRVRLAGSKRGVSFTVDDSGLGFDPSRVRRGSGLTNLADRIGVLGGELSIESRPGMGTRVHAQIPVAVGPLT